MYGSDRSYGGDRDRGGDRGNGGDRGGFRSQRSFAPVKVGDELNVKIEAVGEKGDGIAKKDGFVLFVPNTSSGEDVKIKVTKVLRKVGFAEVIERGGVKTTPQSEESADDSEEEYEDEEPSEKSSEEESKESEESEDEDSEDSEDFGEEEEEK